jgi:hypothetical protein
MSAARWPAGAAGSWGARLTTRFYAAEPRAYRSVCAEPRLSTRDDRITVRRVPRRVVPLLLMVATAAIFVAPPASAVDRPGYVAVTEAERRQLQPLAQAAVAAFRSGRLETLCGLQSLQAVRRVHGSLAHCRAALARATHPCAGRCTYRVGMVLGLYETNRDKSLGRKTVGWLYLVRGHPRFRGVSELELRFRKEGGRWALGSDVVEAGNSRR